MQCYICLEEMNPWNDEGYFSSCIHPCCGRPVHPHCEEEARKHSLKCPWCRADLPTNKAELKILLKAGVRAKRGWAMMMLADVCPFHRLSVVLLENAIKRLREGDEWSCKLATCAKISLALELIGPLPGATSTDRMIQSLGLLVEAKDEGHPGAKKCIEKLEHNGVYKTK